jgi:3-phosphoshikimate 1-carboxyvinyltransferase
MYLHGLTSESLQGDSALTGIFENFGVRSVFTEKGVHLVKELPAVSSFESDFTLNPDVVQTVAVTCALLGIAFKLTGTQSLKIKETDRVLALGTELAKLGIKLEFPDTGEWISWNGRNRKKPDREILIETYKDHRMAMAFAPASLKAGEIRITDPMVVTKSYPSFWDDLRACGFGITRIA